MPCAVNVLNLLSQVGDQVPSPWSWLKPITLRMYADPLISGVGSKRMTPSRAQQVMPFIAHECTAVKPVFGGGSRILGQMTTANAV